MGNATSGRDAIGKQATQNSSSPNRPGAQRAEADRKFLDMWLVGLVVGDFSWQVTPQEKCFANFLLDRLCDA